MSLLTYRVLVHEMVIHQLPVSFVNVLIKGRIEPLSVSFQSDVLVPGVNLR